MCGGGTDTRRRRAIETILLSLLLTGLRPPVALAAKTDVVVLKNGDRLTCEIEQIERGRLQVSTDDMGTIQIEWDKVASVSSSAPFDVDDLAGNRYLGTLTPSTAAGRVQIDWQGRTDEVELHDVVRMRRLNKSFWRRLDGGLDVGASYTSASSLFKLDLAGTLGFERPGYELSMDASSTLSAQPGVEDTRRNSLSVVYTHRFPKRWVALGQIQAEQNRELGFDLRLSTAAGGGRYLVLRTQDKLLTATGLNLSRERSTEGEETTNVELMALVSYDRFSYDSPKVDVTLTAVGFASLTDGGRYRVELEGQVKREIVKDFYATLRGYESYDNRPPAQSAGTNDYGVTFALGWSF